MRHLGGALAVVALVAAAATALPSQPAARASSGECDGVWVVVDATELGGAVTTGCAPGAPGTGLEALSAAGHRYGFVPRLPGMVCTIDGRPDPCNGAPPDAYWSYWHAQPGGSWSYSTRGAGVRVPAHGSVDGWAFGAGAAPSIPPPEPAPAPAPRPEPDADAPPIPGSDPELEPAPQRDPVAEPQHDAASERSSAGKTEPEPEPEREPASARGPDAAASDEVPVAAAQPSTDEQRREPRWPEAALGAALITGLAAAAARSGRRRRRKEDPVP